MAEIGNEPVGDVGRRRGALGRAETRRGQPVAVREARRVEFAPDGLQPEMPVADGPGNEHAVAGPRAGAANRGGGRAEGGDGERERARRRHRVAAEKREAERFLVRGEAGCEAFQPGVVDPPGQREIEQVAFRPGGHGGEVGKVGPQEPPRDQAGRAVAGEMHALDHAVRGDDQPPAFRRIDERGVVFEAARAGGGRERRQETADQLEFA